MPPDPLAAAAFVHGLLRFRLSVQIQILAMRDRLGVCRRRRLRPRLRPADRLFSIWLSRAWSRWCEALVIVQPTTVIVWLRRRLREYGAKPTGSGKPGRPTVPQE